jgi:hypothetical protein
MDTSAGKLTPSDGASGPAGAIADATACVTALYQAHVVGLVRLAIVMLGDRRRSSSARSTNGCFPRSALPDRHQVRVHAAELHRLRAGHP